MPLISIQMIGIYMPLIILQNVYTKIPLVSLLMVSFYMPLILISMFACPSNIFLCSLLTCLPYPFLITACSFFLYYVLIKLMVSKCISFTCNFGYKKFEPHHILCSITQLWFMLSPFLNKKFELLIFTFNCWIIVSCPSHPHYS